MRICLISGEFPPMQGGVSDYTHELGQAMADLGHDVLVLTSVRAADQGATAGYRVFPVVRDWGWPFWNTWREFCRRERPDVVNVQYQAAAYHMKPAINLLPWRMRLWREEQPALIVTFHDLLVPFLFRGAGPLRRMSIDCLARGAQGVVATNEEDFGELDTRAPAVPRRLIPIGPNVMPRSAKPVDRAAWRKRWGIGEDQLALAYFGFVNQSKGGEELIEALAKLVAEGRDVRLLMIGGRVGASDPTNLAYLHRVQGLIAERDLTSRVVWTDYLPADEATATLMAVDICVLPYRDGVSTRRGALMAALVHGLPVVTTTPRVPLAQFRDGENVLLVPPEDSESLAAGIARLADDVDLRRQIGAGAELLAQQFTWPAIAESTLAFFAELLAS